MSENRFKESGGATAVSADAAGDGGKSVTASPLIACEGLVKRYGSRIALSVPTLEIPTGGVFGLIGPNGAGKSTFISLLATLQRPTSGDIRVGSGSVVRTPAEVRRRIGYVPQELAIYPALSARHNLEFWAGVHRLPARSRRAAVMTALEAVGLADRADERASTFSGGMKRRLNLAAALMHDPEILIMDEPTAGVDVRSRRCIAEIIDRHRAAGRTIVFTSHYIDELESICDRLAVLHAGRVLHAGTLQEILGQAGKPSLEALMLELEDV